MLTIFKELLGRNVYGLDGLCGQVKDIYFDDRTGEVTDIVISVGRWPARRSVLLAPPDLNEKQEGVLMVGMTGLQVRRLPHPDTHPPISKQGRFTQYDEPSEAPEPAYLERSNAPGVRTEVTIFDVLLRNRERRENLNHLRNVRAITGYEVELQGNRSGQVADLWLDTRSWQITHLSLQLRALKRRIGVPVALICGISIGSGTVRLNADWVSRVREPVWLRSILWYPGSAVRAVAKDSKG